MNYPRRILITGATGLLGQDLVPSLLTAGYKVRLLVRPQSILPFSPHPYLTLHRGDITDPQAVNQAVKGIDAVIHLAANKYHPVLSFTVNVGGAENLKRAMLESGVKRLINLSTQATKIKHKGVYGLTKLKSDQILHDPKKFQVTTLKPSLVYGKDQTSLFQTIATYVQKLPVVPIFGNGNWTMYPIWVHDVSLAIIRCLKDQRTVGKTYDLGCREKISMNALVDLIARILGKPARKLHVPTPIGLLGAYTLRFFSDNPKVTVDNILGSTQDTHCRPARAIRELGLKPLPILPGLRQTLLPPANQPRVIVIGSGKMGLLHTAILTALPNAQVVAVVDTNRSLLKTARTWGPELQTFSSLSQAIAATHPDIAFICTPTHTHLSLAQECLSRGLHVFIEKPTTPSYSQTTKLLRLSRDYPHQQVFTGYYYLYRPLYQLAKSLLAKKTLGKIKSFSGTILHSEVFGPKRGWLFDPHKSGGGVLINPSPHLFSLLTYFFGLPSQVSCTIRSLYSRHVEDEAKVKLVYKSGLTGKLTASWSRPGVPVLQNHLIIKGTRGSLGLTNNQLFVNSRSVPLPPPPVFNLNPAQGAEGYFLQDETIINSLIGKTYPLGTLSFADKVERIISRCYESAAANSPVAI